MKNYTIGMKYQIYEGDELKVYRLIRIKNVDTVVLQRLSDKQNIIISGDALMEKYVALENDAFLNCMITTAEDGIGDVYVCVNHCASMASGNNEPALVLRQNVYSSTKNQFALGSDIYVGDCVTLAMLGQNEKVSDLFEFAEIVESASVAIYIDDDIDTMLSLLPSKFMKSVEGTLGILKSMDKTGAIKGYCSSLKELMTTNNFMECYLSTFNIAKIKFPIILGDDSFDAEGDIKLNKKQHALLERELGRFLSDVKVIKYDRDLDISQIVNTTHSMVCDTNNEIFLVAYTVDGYIGDSDVAQAMRARTS